MSGFDFDKYKAQCLVVAKAFKELQCSKITHQTYDQTVSQASMLTPAVVSKIERELIVMGSSFRPVDAYQF